MTFWKLEWDLSWINVPVGGIVEPVAGGSDRVMLRILLFEAVASVTEDFSLRKRFLKVAADRLKNYRFSKRL